MADVVRLPFAKRSVSDGEITELVQAFSRIEDPEIRAIILELLKNIADGS